MDPGIHFHSYEPPAAAAPTSSYEDDIERATRESLLLHLEQAEPQFGEPLSREFCQAAGYYYEHQAAGSDTCGLNALNNLCQRSRFTLEDLQSAEAANNLAENGGSSFVFQAPAKDVPTGYFDVEALKIAARTAELEIVDVEPTADYHKSPCWEFTQAAASSVDGSWFLGFLVYDRRPGHVMHYYALRRDERFEGVWLKLDSQLSGAGELSKNRRLTEADMWALYASSAGYFQSWLMRWYPLIYKPGAAQEVVRAVARATGKTLDEGIARQILRRNGWQVLRATAHLIDELPQTVARELSVRFAQPSQAEIRAALESAAWNVAAAQPGIEDALRRRLALVHGFDNKDAPLCALSLCSWNPIKAAKLLSLQLQLQMQPEGVSGSSAQDSSKAGGGKAQATATAADPAAEDGGVVASCGTSAPADAEAIGGQKGGETAVAASAATAVVAEHSGGARMAALANATPSRTTRDKVAFCADTLAELSEALDVAGGDIHLADSALRLLPSVGDLRQAVNLLTELETRSVQAAKRVLAVRTRCPHVAMPMVLQALQQNDDDPHAASEMLLDYEKRVQQSVLEHNKGELATGDEVAIADSALSRAAWEPKAAFAWAKSWSLAVQHTRRQVRSRGVVKFVPVDVVLAALTAGEMNPKAAASIVLGAGIPPKAADGNGAARPGEAAAPRTSGAPSRRPPAVPPAVPSASSPAEDGETCVIA